MHSSLVLFVCLAVVFPSALSLNCCIPELVEKIQGSCASGLLDQEKSFVMFRACILSDTDADRFTYVYGGYYDDSLTMTVNRTVEPLGAVTRQYSFQDNGDCTYEQIDQATAESFTVYPIFSSRHYTAKYGCKNTDNADECADGSNYVQCSFPPGTPAKFHSECQKKLDAVVKDYITTENVCKS